MFGLSSAEARLDLDVVAMLSLLAEHRPVFHSERDLQHALAWQIQLACPEAQIRLEPRPRRGIHLDLLVRRGKRRTAIELKYLVAALHASVRYSPDCGPDSNSIRMIRDASSEKPNRQPSAFVATCAMARSRSLLTVVKSKDG